MKLGDVVYVYRSYGREAKTFDEYLKRWDEYEIKEETRVSWIAQFGYRTKIKIDKKTETCRDSHELATSHEAIRIQWETMQWFAARYRIGEMVQRTTNVELLKKIADLVGYTHDPK